MFSPTGYCAHFIIDFGEGSPDIVTLPILHWTEDGVAVVCNKDGRLVTTGQQRTAYETEETVVKVVVYPTSDPQEDF